MVYKCLRSETTDVHGLGQVKSCVFIVHRNPVWFFLEMRLLYVWYQDVGRGSRLGQWGTCSSSRGWIEGGRAGEVMWRLIGYTGWGARVTSIGSLLPGLWGRACFLSPQQFCEPQEQRMISLCPSTEHVSTVAPRTPDIAISSGPLTLKGKVVHMSPWLWSWITAWHMAAPLTKKKKNCRIIFNPHHL